MPEAATEIHNLIHRYAECIDLGDFPAVAELLADAEVGAAGGPTVTGREALEAMFTASTRLHPDGTPGTKHVTTNVILEIDDDAGTASSRSYWTVLQAVPGLPLQPILAGRYHDRFARTDGQWRFTERRYLIDLVGDLSHHLLIGLPSTE